MKCRRPSTLSSAALLLALVVGCGDPPADTPADAQVEVDQEPAEDAPSAKDTATPDTEAPDAGAPDATQDAGGEDAGGGEDVVPAVPPVPRIASVPSQIAVVGQPWAYQVVAFPAGPLAVELLSGPAGMVLDPTNRLTWTPGSGADAKVTVAVEVAGETVEQSFTVRVLAPGAAVSGTIGVSGGVFPVGVGALAGAALVVPPGALPGPTDLTAALLSTGLGVPGAVGSALLLGPGGTTFGLPATLVLPSQAPAGVAHGVADQGGAWTTGVAQGAGPFTAAALGHLSAWQLGSVLPLTVSLHEVPGCGFVGAAQLDESLTGVPVTAVAGVPGGSSAKSLKELVTAGEGTLQAVLTADLLWGPGASVVVQAGVYRRADGSGRLVARVVGAPPLVDGELANVDTAWSGQVEPLLRGAGLAVPLGTVASGPWGTTGTQPSLRVSLRYAYVGGDGFGAGAPTAVPLAAVVGTGVGGVAGGLPAGVTAPTCDVWTLRALPAPPVTAPGVGVTLGCRVDGDAGGVDVVFASSEPSDVLTPISGEAAVVAGTVLGRREITCSGKGPGGTDRRTIALDIVATASDNAAPSCALSFPAAALALGETMAVTATASDDGEGSQVFVEVGAVTGGVLGPDPRVLPDGRGGALVAPTDPGLLTLGCRAFDGAIWGPTTTRVLQVVAPDQHLPPTTPIIVPPVPVVKAGVPLSLWALTTSPGGEPVAFTWGPANLVTGAGTAATFLAPAPGAYTIEVAATNGLTGPAVASVTVLVIGSGTDGDGDGIPAGEAPWGDCDDADPAIHPAAIEVCGNGVDDDCSGTADDCPPPAPDMDGDGVADGRDTCPTVFDPGQADTDGDGIGDACDGDSDGDGTPDGEDPCPFTAGGSGADLDGDGTPDACDLDIDGDGVFNAQDDCPYQTGGPAGCGGDWEGDGVPDAVDVCPKTPDPGQTDLDGDGDGDACDTDRDGDGVPDTLDTCPALAGVPQTDTDGDGLGDACDPDDDGDGVEDAVDSCPLVPDVGGLDTDLDGLGDACDPDDDQDGAPDDVDNCPLVYNPSQSDIDGDGLGNPCDNDDDGDGVPDLLDDCPGVYDPLQADEDRDGVGDACECASIADCTDESACTADACTELDGCTHAEDACFDGDPCTADSCDPASGCVHIPIPNCAGCATSADCNDKDACNGQELCVAGACLPGTPVVCDDDDPCNGTESCTEGLCAPGLSVACDDGDPCNGEEVCTDGDCASGAPLPCDDGDVCTSDACAAGVGCTHAAISCDDGDPCTGDTCSQDGGCVHEPYPDCGTCMEDADCDDGDLCSGVETCVDGLCLYGALVQCDDGNPCNGVESCAAGDCVPGTAPPCADGDPCTLDLCIAPFGCVNEAVRGCAGCVDDAGCDDGVVCNGLEACIAGGCVPGVPVDCDDGDACNGAESCADGACVAGDPLPCNDGDACNGAETCVGGACAPGTPLVCNDGDPCNGVESCGPGGCVPGTPLECDDGNPCTDDACRIPVGCDYTLVANCTPPCASNASCDDGNACNGTETCAEGACLPGTPVLCDDGDACNGTETCAGGVCLPGTPVLCDDGDACNGMETCAAGVCLPGTSIPCYDGDACNGVETCVSGVCLPGTPVSCDDGDPCNGAETCIGGDCLPGTPVSCDDGDACTADACVAESGCTHAPIPDCGACVVDGACEGVEDCASCPDDCGPCAACPGGGGDCFTENATPGCEDVACCEAVCAADPFCCKAAWDLPCADVAGTLCGGPLCGDLECDAGETCASCPGDCGGCSACPGDGDCFAPNGTPGCQDPLCCEAVCAADSFCCDTAWDGLCVDEATSLCAGPPGCDAGSCDDANPCTIDVCDPELMECLHSPADGAACAEMAECWAGQCYSLLGDTTANPIVLPPPLPVGVLIHMEALHDDYALFDCPGFPLLGDGTPDAVVELVAPADGDVAVIMSSPQNAALAILATDSPDPGTCVDASVLAGPGADTVLVVSVQAGQTLRVLVENLDGSGGTATVILEPVDPF